MLYRSIRRIALMAIVAAFGLWAAPSQSQQTPQSQALVAAGYTRSLLIISQEAPPEIVKYQCGSFTDGDGNTYPRYCGRYPFDQTRADTSGRYGVDYRWVKGDTVLERGISGLDPCQLEFLGLPRDYVTTTQDRQDSSKVTKDGSRAAFDALPRCGPTPPPTSLCAPPMACMLPCTACPTCPVCPPPPLPPPACAPMPQFVRRTIDKASRFTGKRAWGAVQAWAASCPK